MTSSRFVSMFLLVFSLMFVSAGNSGAEGPPAGKKTVQPNTKLKNCSEEHSAFSAELQKREAFFLKALQSYQKARLKGGTIVRPVRLAVMKAQKEMIALVQRYIVRSASKCVPEWKTTKKYEGVMGTFLPAKPKDAPDDWEDGWEAGFTASGAGVGGGTSADLDLEPIPGSSSGDSEEIPLEEIPCANPVCEDTRGNIIVRVCSCPDGTWWFEFKGGGSSGPIK
jgi:hypothetical protein